jgi:hypothetical protein
MMHSKEHAFLEFSIFIIIREFILMIQCEDLIFALCCSLFDCEFAEHRCLFLYHLALLD